MGVTTYSEVADGASFASLALVSSSGCASAAASVVRAILSGAAASSDSPSGRFRVLATVVVEDVVVVADVTAVDTFAPTAAVKRANRTDRRCASVPAGASAFSSAVVVAAAAAGTVVAAGDVAVGTGRVIPGLPNTRPLAPPDAKAANPPVEGGDAFKKGLVVVVIVAVVVVVVEEDDDEAADPCRSHISTN